MLERFLGTEVIFMGKGFSFDSIWCWKTHLRWTATGIPNGAFDAWLPRRTASRSYQQEVTANYINETKNRFNSHPKFRSSSIPRID
ncbi:hypothetical protein U9M48_000988 [Paspalum notatum var. saurae]|uniref:Uncharacterized protein n=1 Tax=Paspalum notatum var. saurae TaxID=547442 RepID=A0AAQ3PFE1_PASNO